MGAGILLTGLVLCQPSDPFGGLDRGLVAEITGWKKGAPAPRKLLQFPDGPPALPPLCGLRAFGDSVGDYISHISDDELLQALMFDPMADAACIRVTARRLLVRRGVKDVRAMLADQRTKNAAVFDGTELATLTQLLMSPYARIRVASLEKKDASKALAEKAIEGLKADLVAAIPWDRAYRKAADLLIDKERSEKEGGGWRTFLGYRYDGLVSPTGFDLLDRRISDQLEQEHIRMLFEAKRGVLRFESAAAYWLYFVEAFYE
jgi:hypothetical protein